MRGWREVPAHGQGRPVAVLKSTGDTQRWDRARTKPGVHSGEGKERGAGEERADIRSGGWRRPCRVGGLRRLPAGLTWELPQSGDGAARPGLLWKHGSGTLLSDGRRRSPHRGQGPERGQAGQVPSFRRAWVPSDSTSDENDGAEGKAEQRERVRKLREGEIPGRGTVAALCQTEAAGKALRPGHCARAWQGVTRGDQKARCPAVWLEGQRPLLHRSP